jgi:hypothetical protein
MQRLYLAVLLALLMLLALVSMVSAQQVGSNTSFITSITFMNVGTADTTVQFQFYSQKAITVVASVNAQINRGASSSVFVGDVNIPSGFLGSAVMSSDQPIVVTVVQVPQPTNGTVKNRPISNGFSDATSNLLLATVLKNSFSTVSRFSIQNADTGNIDITIKFYDAANPNASPITVTETNIPPGSAKYYRMDQVGLIPAATFNGSATVTAVRSGTQTPAKIIGTVLELSTTGPGVSAFEGVSGGSTPIYVASALCEAFGGASTSYAVQNVGTAAADVTVKYKGVNLMNNAEVNVQATSPINPGAKVGFRACDAPGMPENFSGAATVESSVPLVVIAKVFGAGLTTAWLGEGAGAEALAFPYVRYSDDAKYISGQYQRVFLAIQNVGSATVSNVVVEYRDKNGTLLGTHLIPSIAASAKAGSNASLATPAAGVDPNKLLFFGHPESNPNGGFGGGATVVGPSGSTLIGVARVTSNTEAGRVAEDYNGHALDNALDSHAGSTNYVPVAFSD